MPYRSVYCLPALLLAVGAAAQTEIHRCQQEDGTVAFQETPCAEAEAEAEAESPGGDGEARNGEKSRGGIDGPEADDDAFVNPFDRPEADDTSVPRGPPAPPETELPASLSGDRATCEDSTRDAIDAIDREMRKGFTSEQGRQYLARLLELTEQLRACKRL